MRRGGVILVVLGSTAAIVAVAVGGLGVGRRGTKAATQEVSVADDVTAVPVPSASVRRPSGVASTEPVLLKGAAVPLQASPTTPGHNSTEPEASPVQDAHENRQRIVRDIIASGPTKDEWSRRAPVAFSNFMNAVPEGLADHIEVAGVLCYKKACMVAMSYSDMATFDKTNPMVLGSDAFQGWPGPKGRTAVEVLDSGSVEVTWLLMRPDNQAP